MKIGKVPVEVLERIVLNPINANIHKRDDIVVRPKTGEDCSAAYLGDELCVISTDPITGAKKDAAYIAVHINCNDIASCGAEPIGIMLTVLLPDGSTEEMLLELMQGAYRAARELDIEILGGHTEITDAVNKPVISGTVIGKTIGRKFISSGGAKLGQEVIMTKWAGIEGTAIIANDNEDKLRKLVGKETTEKAKSLSSFLSVVKEGRISALHGATAMHDATEGGILGAVWEVADCSKCGMEIYLDKIPVLDETIAICKCAGIDPLRLISSGVMIITAFEAPKLVEKLRDNGIFATIIGKITEEGKYIIEDGKKKELISPMSDELYNVKL